MAIPHNGWKAPIVAKIKIYCPALVFGLAGLLAVAPTAWAAEPDCGQKLVDGATPPSTSSYIYPRQPVQPFYQWENNDGYCGEVSMMQAGINNGQWMSQFNARLICGTGLSQSGPNGACAAHRGQVDYNAQLLIEDPGTGVSGPNTYANAAQCLSNSRLAATTFDYSAQTPGMAGYAQCMSWVKQEVINGHQVTIAILLNGGSDPQYDHEAAIIKIGTNHSPTDAAYYPDDVVYFDDHGVYTLSGSRFTSNPAIPPGAGTDSTGCTPFVFGYTFGSLANTRAGANLPTAQAYSIVIPSAGTIHTYTGGSGYDAVRIAGPHNYGFSVAGPQDPASVTLPVALTIVGPTVTKGSMNPLDPVAGYDYENPMIGTSVWGQSCTNTPPDAWMTNFVLQVAVSGLTPGVSYNLYEYEFSSVEGQGSEAALAVPVENFNANAGLAAHVTTFTAVGSVFQQTVHYDFRQDRSVPLRPGQRSLKGLTTRRTHSCVPRRHSIRRRVAIVGRRSLHGTVSQEQVDEVLIGHPQIGSQILEVVDRHGVEADSDLTLELLGVGILAGLGKIVFFSYPE